MSIPRPWLCRNLSRSLKLSVNGYRYQSVVIAIAVERSVILNLTNRHFARWFIPCNALSLPGYASTWSYATISSNTFRCSISAATLSIGLVRASRRIQPLYFISPNSFINFAYG